MIAGLKYIYDEAGNVEAAIVPIEVWRGIEEQMNDGVMPSQPAFDPADYENILIGKDVESIIKEMRDEWERSF